MLQHQVVVFLPRYRSQFANDLTQFQQQLYENQKHPHPHQGTIIFVNYNEGLIQCYVKHYDVDTRLHEVKCVDTGTVLHLALANKKGPRWFMFCYHDNDAKIPTSLVCMCEHRKQDMMQVLRRCCSPSTRYATSTEFLQTLCDKLTGQLYTCALFMKKCDAETLIRNCVVGFHRIMYLGQLLPEDILMYLLQYMIPMDMLKVHIDVFCQLL